MLIKVLLPVCYTMMEIRSFERKVPLEWGLVGLTPPAVEPDSPQGVVLPFDVVAEGEDWRDTAARICKEFAGADIYGRHFVLKYLSLCPAPRALVVAPFCVPDEDAGYHRQPRINVEHKPLRIYEGVRIVDPLLESSAWLLPNDAEVARAFFAEDCRLVHPSLRSSISSFMRSTDPIVLGRWPGWQARCALVGPPTQVPDPPPKVLRETKTLGRKYTKRRPRVKAYR
jgi:hypothetical protein